MSAKASCLAAAFVLLILLLALDPVTGNEDDEVSDVLFGQFDLHAILPNQRWWLTAPAPPQP